MTNTIVPSFCLMLDAHQGIYRLSLGVVDYIVKARSVANLIKPL